MGKEKIKVGIYIDCDKVPAWVYLLMQLIVESDYSTLSLVLIINRDKKGQVFKNLYNNYKHALYLIYRKLENKIIRLQPDAFVLKDIQPLIKDVNSIIHVNTIEIDNTFHFAAKDIEIIKRNKLDVFLNVVTANLQKEICDYAYYGLWSLQNNFSTITGLGVWEVIKGLPVSESMLLMWKSNIKSPYILYHSSSATNSNIKRNMNNVYWKSLSFVLRKLREIHEYGGEVFLQKINLENLSYVENNQLKQPGNIVFLSYLLKNLRSKLTKKIWNQNNFEQWSLIFKFIENDKAIANLNNYKYLLPPKEKFWADPSVFSIHDKYYIFFEEYVYKTRKAHISMCSMDREGNYSEPETVLKKPYHLSYPFVFKSGTDIYMIPETSANKTVELYKCTLFPQKWKFEMNLMNNLHAVDATIHYQDNKYWLFLNMKENKGASAWDELFLFYSQTLVTTNWHAHPMNPIVSDVSSARPAGRLFIKNGKLYRPSQDCSKTYGYAININEVLILNEKEYKERKETVIYPEWNKNSIATHTFSYDNDLVVMDVREKRKK